MMTNGEENENFQSLMRDILLLLTENSNIALCIREKQKKNIFVKQKILGILKIFTYKKYCSMNKVIVIVDVQFVTYGKNIKANHIGR